MSDLSVLLVIPPLTQLNTPYPSTAYLTGFLRSQGYRTHQADVGIEMVLALFSRGGLSRVFAELRKASIDELPGEARQMLSLERAYVETINPVISFLQGRNPTLASRICQGTFLPQGPRFSLGSSENQDGKHRAYHQADQAKHLATLYLEDLADLVQATITPHFALSRYAESIAMQANSYDRLEEALAQPLSLTDEWMVDALWRHVDRHQPGVVGFSVPFPGNLYGALRMGQQLRVKRPEIKVVLGGGYPNTELRRMRDPRLFEVVDFVTLDDGERPFLCLLEYLEGKRREPDLCRTFLRSGQNVVWQNGADEPDVSQVEVGTPTYDGLPLNQYISVLDTLNPMHRLWSDGHWNKLTVAHGCYWKQCTFCDVGLDYIGRYEVSPGEMLVDRIEALIAETGRCGFHFVDEAAPPAGLKNLALSLLEREVTISWWGNVRFEPAFTPDLCRLLAASGCIALSAGLEAACDRLLALVKKGITVDQTVRVVQACRDAEILVHAYLMYGIPSETIGETIESLERVRQLFAHDLIQSAFWHRFTTTAHSPIGLHPQAYGIHLIGPAFGGFAENDLVHGDDLASIPEWIGEGLRAALWHYKEGLELTRDVREWFPERVPKPKVKRTWVKQVLESEEREDHSRLERKFVWIGGQPDVDRGNGEQYKIILPNRTTDEEVRLKRGQGEWFLNLIERAVPVHQAGGHRYPIYKEVRAGFPFGGPKGFDKWWQSASAHKARTVGLLLV
ncbi:B12-binding domain-containing radical SAM protein [Candidatus Nitrospira allomarina]|uniref:Radical SAM protein n=1 Tax=Candidatus Nitrospira allomarina TaxID=3020900 RepID=A0AA96GF96_9BACT|nr:radical SAM protein [Candidatus Nitrospira allomarina]WNM56711.1 radical SAM protein [Candidatus Nitrospira allomarina]